MANLTLRNVPEPVFDRVRAMAAMDRRSMNSEILVLIERGLAREPDARSQLPMPEAEVQLGLWEKLCGSWEDSRSAAEVADDIRAHRTEGREVAL